MKTLAWQQFFAEQREQHGKVLFSVAELANVAQTPLHALNTEIGRLVRRGVIARYAHGIYGLPGQASPETVVAAIDSEAYLTGFYVLFLRGLVTQAPTQITCFTNRRHNRRGRHAAESFRFICVPKGVYQKPSGPTSGEQALCDFTWEMLRAGVAPRSLVTFRNLHKLNARRLHSLLKAYPQGVQQTVAEITERCRDQIQAGKATGSDKIRAEA